MIYNHRGDATKRLINDYPTGWIQEAISWARLKYIGLRNGSFRMCERSIKSQTCCHYLVPSYKEVPIRRLTVWNEQRLLAKWRLRRLYAVAFPESAHAYADQIPLTTSNLVLSILDMLQELKREVLRNHHMRLRSAIISSPNWLNFDAHYIFREACFLAKLECLESWRDNLNTALKTAPRGKSVLILDHGEYHLDLHYATWFGSMRPESEAYIQDSLKIARAGSLNMAGLMLGRIIGNYHQYNPRKDGVSASASASARNAGYR